MRSTTRDYFWRGCRDGAPFILMVGPFAALFGVVATEAGLDLAAVMTFSVTVFAGAAQFTALQLIAEETPTIIVLVSALAVNLRVAMYSASLTPFLGAAPLWQRACIAYLTVDQSYAVSILRFERDRDMSLADRVAYFFGTVAPVAPVWYLMTLLGALLGARIPEAWSLDFILPIAFLSIVAPMLRTPAHVAAALVGSATALLAAGLPYNLGLMVAGIAGMATGARVEVALARRAAAS